MVSKQKELLGHVACENYILFITISLEKTSHVHRALLYGEEQGIHKKVSNLISVVHSRRFV